MRSAETLSENPKIGGLECGDFKWNEQNGYRVRLPDHIILERVDHSKALLILRTTFCDYRWWDGEDWRGYLIEPHIN